MADKGLRHNMSHFGQSELDLSFLKEEEANRILEVLERDERLRRTEQERLSKLKSWKRDVKWLHAVSGEWFEEIQKKKFKDDPDVRSLVRPPLNHRLKKKTPKGEPESSRMTTSRNFQSPKNSGPSFLGLRSPLSSLFSFRKSAKQTLKPPSQHERHGIFSVSGQLPPNTKVDRKFDIYHSTRSVKQIASFFEEQHNNRARENDTTKATNQLEREVLQVLGDLDQKLAQEQNHNRAPRISRLANYTYGRQYSKEGLLHNKAEPKNVYGCLPSHDGRRSGPPEGTHTTYATYQPRNFYEMYSNRQRRVSKPEGSNKSFYNKSPSLFSAVSNITPRSSPASGSFSTSSLQLSSPGLNLERIRQNKSRRTPITSIKWNNSVSSGHPEGIGRAFRTKSALDLTNLDEPNHLCKYKNVPGPPVSTSNDLHEDRNIKNLTNTTCMNIVDNRSTGYYITDSPGHCPEVKFSTQPERHWEEDFKKTSFNKNEMSRAPSDNTGSSDMETEPMELESDLSVQPDASSVAIEEPSIHEGDIPVDCTLHNPEPLEVSSSHISEPENMDIDAPNVFLNSRNSSTSTVGLGPSAHKEDHVPPKTKVPGLALTDHNRSLDTIKKFSSFDHGTVYKVDTSSFTNPKSSEISDQVNKSDHKTSSLSGNTTDVGGRFAWMNMRRGSNNHTEGFRSDALKFQKRNASSLPDLLDQDSEIVANNSDVTLHKRTCENVLECGATTVPATQPSSRISNDSNELHLENDSKYEQPCVQNSIPQKLKNLSTRNHQYLQKPNKFSYCGAFKNLDRTATFPAVPYEAESLKEKYNHTGFLSDTLKYKKRNASSLSDLLDQESDIFGNDPENILRKNGCGHDGDYHTSTVLETRSSRIPDERKERYLESSTRYQQSGVQDTNQQPKISTSSTWQSIQRVSPFSRGSELNGSSIQTEKTATESEVAYQADRVTENNKFKNLLHLTETTPFSNVHAKYKSVNFNRGQYNGSDSNNNTQLIGGIQTSDILNKDKSRIEKGYIHQNQDHPEKEQVKSLKCDTSSKPNLSSIYQKDAASSANQKNTDQDRQVEQGCESEGNLNQNLIYQLDQEANNKVEYTDPPKIRGSSRFPVSHFVKECSEEDNFSRATHLHNIESKSTNLLKQHLFVAPEPFKGNVRVSVIPKSEWKNLTSSEDSQSPTHQEGENIKNLDSDYRASEEDLQPHKTYSCQQIVENTEMYESLTDTYAEVDKIEYRKVVSVYYSFPRKFASRISDLSKNNLKNIDQTLQQSRAPSALLDIIGRCHKEEPDFHLQSSEDVKTSITEAVHSVADVPSQTHHLNFHIIPLQTNLLKNGSRTNSGEENDDLVNKFSSLHISKNEDNHKAREDPKNKNKYSPSGSSPRYSPNACYFTLPNRKSSLQDLERNVLERDIAMARDRFNIYPGSRNMEPSPPEFQDVFASPTACYDNLNYSPGYDFMHFQESSKQEYNINNIFARDGGFYKKNSMDEGIILREDLPSIYKSKSYKDLSQHKSYNTEDISPHTDCNTSPQIDYNHPVFSKNSSVINQARPSYCSEFVQKKMKPINTKKFSLSVDRSSQESVSPRHTGSYDDTIRLFDGNSPSVFHSPNNNYTSHADKYFGQTKPRDSGNSNLYRSKSMKVLNTEGQQNFVDYKQKSDGSFSSKSYGGTLRSKSPSGKTWNRTSSAEILDENDNWPVSDERKAVCTSKSFDYGIFGKEQQEAIVNNVKRSLTEGRLWRPSFLKNPGFLRTEELCSSQEINPVGQTPDESSSQRPNVKESLNIYEDVHVVPSDSDTETTTEDEYYLDEYYLNDKESEL